MSNKTQAAAISVRGQNPQNLIEAIVRQKIYQNRYWKEKLPGLTAASIIDEALELDYIGGTYGGSRKPSKFIMLALKLLQISPEIDEVMEYIKQEDYKYLTALGCFYLRLTASAVKVFTELEPLYQDFRKLRYRGIDGQFTIVHMDEFIDSLLNEEVYLDTLLPHIGKRYLLEEKNQLKPRISPLEELLQEELKVKAEEEKKQKEIQEQKEKEEKEEIIAKNENNLSEGEEKEDKNDRTRKERDDHKDKKRKEEKKHKRHRSRSDSNSKKKHSNWRKVIRGKHTSNRVQRSKSRSRSKSESPKEKEPPKDSIEYWNKIRADMGLPLL